jgi:hypothetical protein
MLREIKGTQRLSRLLAFKVNGTNTAAIEQGAPDASLTDNGAGDYTITFDRPFARKPIVTASCETEGCYAEIASASQTSVQIKTLSNAGVATDAIFHAVVLGFDSADET